MRKGQDAHSLGGSTGYVFRSPKSKVGGAGQEDVFLDNEELLSCSSRLPSMTDSILMSLTNVAGMEWNGLPHRSFAACFLRPQLRVWMLSVT